MDVEPFDENGEMTIPVYNMLKDLEHGLHMYAQDYYGRVRLRRHTKLAGKAIEKLWVDDETGVMDGKVLGAYWLNYKDIERWWPPE